MLRRFRQHDLRQVQDLSGVWDFAFLGDVDPDRVKLRTIAYDDRMNVPGCFDATPRYAGKRGLAAYRTTANLTLAGMQRLVVDGLHHWGRVYVNGELLKEHVGGFTRFNVDFVNTQPGEAEIVILADNRIDYDRCPLHLDYFDWYHYGGIARGVELHQLPGLFIDRLVVATTDLKSRTISLDLHYRMPEDQQNPDLLVEFDGQPVLREKLNLRHLSGVIQRSVKLPGAKLWSPQSPNLHLVRVQLGDDDVTERIGLRQVRVRGKQILLNNKPLTLLGFNRHEGSSMTGHAQPWHLLVTDVQQLKDMGVNFIRGSHYPQDVRFLDLCDEAGICVWVESIGWQHTAEHLTDPKFIKAQSTIISEMTAAAGNRPSVIMWGLLNESHSQDRKARPGYKTLIEHIRKCDPTRPVTYACNHPWDDRCMDLIDIVALNTYPGWYWGSIDTMPEELDKVVKHLDRQPQCRNKPLIVSEIGAEGIYGFRDWNKDRWSEEWQAAVHEQTIQHLFITRKRAMGLTIWLYNDFRACNNVHRAMGRARGFNNKGVVDEYRRPKLAYHAVKALYRKLLGLDAL